MVVLGTFVLCGVGFAAAFAFFAAGRFLAGSAFRLTDRVLPFGEAPPSGFARARPGARLAVTLAGPLAVYAFAALLCVLGMVLGASVPGEGTTILHLVGSSPAAAAGLQENDRITSVAGIPVTRPADLRSAITARADGPVEVVVRRQGRELRFAVAVGPDRKLGVQLGPNQEGLGLGKAIGAGVAYPAQILSSGIAALFEPVKVEVVGPVGITREIARQPSFGDRLLTVGALQAIGVVMFLLGSFALWPPRMKRRTYEPLSRESPVAPRTPMIPRPGLRLMARAIDWSLIGLPMVLVAPAAAALSSFIWFPIEAALLASWGFTPGKRLLGIAVRDADGRRPTFRHAFRRAAVVWAYGTGADTPFGLATGVLAYGNLKRGGTTYWDALGGYTVHHRPVGAARVAIAALILVLALGAAITVAGA
jgi:hypothetical protein